MWNKVEGSQASSPGQRQSSAGWNTCLTLKHSTSTYHVWDSILNVFHIVMFYYPKHLMGKALLFSSFPDEGNGSTEQLKYLPSSGCLGVEGPEIFLPGCVVLKPCAIIEHSTKDMLRSRYHAHFLLFVHFTQWGIQPSTFCLIWPKPCLIVTTLWMPSAKHSQHGTKEPTFAKGLQHSTMSQMSDSPASLQPSYQVYWRISISPWGSQNTQSA